MDGETRFPVKSFKLLISGFHGMEIRGEPGGEPGSEPGSELGGGPSEKNRVIFDWSE